MTARFPKVSRQTHHGASPRFPLALVVSITLAVTAQEPETADRDERVLALLPKTVSAPKDNPTTPKKVTLGKQLFFDRRLSGDNNMSCASCHLPDKAFSDGLARSMGAAERTLLRNAPTLLNVAHMSPLFWDGRAASLEEQALAPIQSPDEMNQNLDKLEQELNDVSGYVNQFRDVFGSTIKRDGIAKALAAFQRTLVSGPSPFDRYLSGDEKALSEQAKLGLELFLGDAGCVRCHHGPMLSDGKFYRLGISYTDKGLGAVTGRQDDHYKFRTPTLRNVAHTAPYMHDGSLQTLDDVVFFYFRGVSAQGSGGGKLDVEPLGHLSFSDITAVVAFLESLSGKLPAVTRPALP